MEKDNFADKLLILMEYLNLSASEFADKIGVQRSAISHILSARNKPSLNFISKIIDTFGQINLYWLVKSSGDMILNNGKDTVSSSHQQTQLPKKIMPDQKSKVEKVILLYKDKTLDVYDV